MQRTASGKDLDWTDRFAVGIPAILLATCQTVGCRISIEYHTSVHRTMQSWLEQVPIAGWILWWIAETLLFGQMLRWLFVHAGRDKAVQEDGIGKGIGKRIFFIFAGLLIAWLPVLLSHDPGFYNYDIYGQVPQVMYPEVPYNTHHSLLSTLVMGGVITIGYRIFGTMEKAVFLHSCFQMILCAATFSYSLDFWYRRLNRKWLLGVGFCFYAFLPTIALFSVSTTKDVVCSLALFIAFHLLYELYENTEGFFRKKEKIAALSCSLIVGALYRKNVIYAVFLYLVLCAVFCKKQKRKIISLFAGTILLTMLLSVGMETLLHAEKGSAVEALCVPLQQIARVYTDKGEAAFDSEELQLLDQIMDREQWSQYNPFLADRIKNYVNNEELLQNKWEYLRLWFRKGWQYPGCYLRAFLDNTYQAWYPGTSVVDDPDGDIYYFDFEGRNVLEMKTISSRLTEFYRKISLEYYYQKIPVIRALFAIGTYFWLAVILFFYGIRRRRAEIWNCWLLVLALCLTVFLGPISLVRYYLLLFYAAPAGIFLLADRA